MRDQSGQASVEWIGLIALLVLVAGGLLAAVPAVDGRSLGGALAHRLTCAATTA